MSRVGFRVFQPSFGMNLLLAPKQMRSNYFSLLDVQAKKDNFSVQTMAEGRGSRTGDPKTARGGGECQQDGVGSRWQSGWWQLEEDGLRGGRNIKRFVSGAGEFSPGPLPPPSLPHTPLR